MILTAGIYPGREEAKQGEKKNQQQNQHPEGKMEEWMRN